MYYIDIHHLNHLICCKIKVLYSSSLSLKGMSPKCVWIIDYLYSHFAKWNSYKLNKWVLRPSGRGSQTVLHRQRYQDKQGGGGSCLSWECARLFIAAITLYGGSTFYAHRSSSPCGILGNRSQWEKKKKKNHTRFYCGWSLSQMMCHEYLWLNNCFIRLSFW